jgi:hypothetical protein
MELTKVALKALPSGCRQRGRTVLVTMPWFVLALSGCSCRWDQPPKEALERERWCIVGQALSPREKGKPIDDWIATLVFPGKEVTRLLPWDVAKPADWPRVPGGDLYVAYNPAGQVLACSEHGHAGEAVSFVDVWLYDLRRKECKPIGPNQWLDVSRLVWSEDGQRLAFMATRLYGAHRESEPVRADVYVYDLGAEKLSVVADDGIVLDTAWWRAGSPVWSEDGKYLYYASIGRDATK